MVPDHVSEAVVSMAIVGLPATPSPFVTAMPVPAVRVRAAAVEPEVRATKPLAESAATARDSALPLSSHAEPVRTSWLSTSSTHAENPSRGQICCHAPSQ